MNLDFPENGEPPVRSALDWPPCRCGLPTCPDAAPAGEGAAPAGSGDGPDQDDGDSDVLRSLRARVREENRARGRWPL